jgi:hypothetical protein
MAKETRARSETRGRKPGPQYDACTVCKHPERARLEHLMGRGVSRTALADKFGLSRDAVGRHWRNHVSDVIKAAAIAKVLKPGESLEKLVTDENIGLLENLQRIRGILHSEVMAAVVI